MKRKRNSMPRFSPYFSLKCFVFLKIYFFQKKMNGSTNDKYMNNATKAARSSLFLYLGYLFSPKKKKKSNFSWNFQSAKIYSWFCIYYNLVSMANIFSFIFTKYISKIYFLNFRNKKQNIRIYDINAIQC